MTENQHRSLDWIQITLIVAVLLVTTFNIILLMRYQKEKRERIILIREKKEEQQTQKTLAHREIFRWQIELQCWPLLEEAIEFIEGKKYREALIKLDKVIDIRQEMEIAYYLRAKTCYFLGKNQQGIEDITYYIEKIPSSIYGLLLRAQFYQRVHDRKHAEEDIEAILQQKPDFAAALQLRKDLKQEFDK